MKNTRLSKICIVYADIPTGHSRVNFVGKKINNTPDITLECAKQGLKWLATLTAVPLGLGSNPGEDTDVCKCIVPSRRGGSLNSCRAASPLVRLVEGEERWKAPGPPQGVLSQNWGETELNRSVTCMVLKVTANDRRHLALCHDEFRGPWSGLCRSAYTAEIIQFEDKKKKKKLKTKVVHDYNTMGSVDKVDQELTDYPVASKRGGSKNYMNYRTAIVEQNKPSVQVPGPGLLSASLMRLKGPHFPKHIPPTGKKSTPTRPCFICCRKTDEKGKRIRRKTRVYCKECDMGLCAVSCFGIYHTVKDL
ncbi:piggyBac transposable element-derived protein 4 [Trichonephila clavipes]|nr:piggyBac transposable element-derived protein 4 [Trichonephila clavipes]